MADEILFGGVGTPRHVPSRDGSDYEEDAPEPSLFGLTNIIARKGWNRVELVAVGRLGSPGQNISGVAITTNLQSIINANNSSGSYHQKVAKLLRAHDTFRHISAFVIKKL